MVRENKKKEACNRSEFACRIKEGNTNIHREQEEEESRSIASS
jgi:hypothetical protein